MDHAGAMSSKKDSLAQTHHVLAEEAFGWDPSTLTAGSNKRVAWKCSKGHVWETSVANRAGKKSGCPFCAGQRVQLGVNDLASKFPELALEADGWDPKTEAYGTAHKRSWVCPAGHSWNATVLSRTQGNGCPFCSNNQVLAGFNDLATVSPMLAKEAYEWDPTTLTPASNKKMKWICSKSHIWSATLNNRKRGTGCPICDGKIVLAGFNDLATTDPEIAAEAAGWDPTTITRSTHKLLKWKCSKSHEWVARVQSRHVNGCPFCGGKRVLKGFNDLATTKKELSRQALRWDPTQYSWGSSKKVNWKCDEGHEWVASIASRARLNRGCPTCASSGFDPNSDAWLYLLEHEKWNMLQVGITNFPEKRIKKHATIGWELIDIRGPIDGLLARKWETSILLMLFNHGAEIAKSDVGARFDGYTESWLKNSYTTKTLRELIAAVEKDENLYPIIPTDN